MSGFAKNTVRNIVMYNTAYLNEYADRWNFFYISSSIANFILLGEVKCDTIIDSAGVFLYTGQ